MVLLSQITPLKRIFLFVDSGNGYICTYCTLNVPKFCALQYLFTFVTPPLVDTPPDPTGSPGSRECVECPVGTWAAVGSLQCTPCGVGDCSQCVSVVSLVPGRTFLYGTIGLGTRLECCTMFAWNVRTPIYRITV